MLYPLTFHPIFKGRVWGGRNLERLYHKSLPPQTPIGESWEISDRPGAVSVIANGPLAGKDLRWLMETHPHELLGTARAEKGRFPLLIKILDATDRLSVQVHPPARRAVELGGEPKTELWYVTHATQGAHVFLGLKSGVSRAEFERRLREGTVAECIHRLPVAAGDALFLPAGRVHALGAGIVLFEIQQNSDTTYRVFDWNRPGLDGHPRPLHVAESLASIDFTDFEPPVLPRHTTTLQGYEIRPLVKDPLFEVEAVAFRPGQSAVWPAARCLILGVVQGQLSVRAGGVALALAAGQFGLVPAVVAQVETQTITGTTFLTILPGE